MPRDISWFEFAQHWPLVVAELSSVHGIDLYDPDVLSWSWLRVRTRILSLADQPTLLRGVLTGR